MGAMVQGAGKGQKGSGGHRIAGIVGRAGENLTRPAGQHLNDDQQQNGNQADRGKNAGCKVKKVKQSPDN